MDESDPTAVQMSRRTLWVAIQVTTFAATAIPLLLSGPIFTHIISKDRFFTYSFYLWPPNWRYELVLLGLGADGDTIMDVICGAGLVSVSGYFFAVLLMMSIWRQGRFGIIPLNTKKGIPGGYMLFAFTVALACALIALNYVEPFRFHRIPDDYREAVTIFGRMYVGIQILAIFAGIGLVFGQIPWIARTTYSQFTIKKLRAFASRRCSASATPTDHAE